VPGSSPGPVGPIDRVAPTRRPDGLALMRQNWSQLLFLHWDLPAEQLRPLLPAGLELDLFEGRALVGLIPFTMTGVRPVGLPAVPWLSNFHETNVRTYVHVEGRDPGVWFFSLDAANPVAVQIARTLFHLPYYFARMSLTHLPPTPEMPMGRVSYGSERRWPGPRGASCAIEAGPRGPVAPAQVGTLEHFLVERYILYAAHRGRLYRGRVHHAPYPLQGAEVRSLDENLIAAAGLTRPDSPPLAHFAGGVRVEVFKPQLVK
jgi:uncharacterized protein YqjF (DUF2071 family)